MVPAKQVKAQLLPHFKKTPLYSFILQSWWMILFLGLCAFLYYQGIQKKIRDEDALKKRLEALEQKKQKAEEEQEDLLLQINSQNDPDWIQMTLMKGLGVVPEGQKKVYFKKED